VLQSTAVAKPLRVLSINFPFATKGIDNVDTLATPKALFDFDVVVLRPHPLLPSEERGMEWKVEADDFGRAERLVQSKKEEFLRFLAVGGLLVVILDSLERYFFMSHSYTHRIQEHCSNYDFLNDSLWRYLRNGTGQQIPTRSIWIAVG
jgi:hypothetical protein